MGGDGVGRGGMGKEGMGREGMGRERGGLFVGLSTRSENLVRINVGKVFVLLRCCIDFVLSGFWAKSLFRFRNSCYLRYASCDSTREAGKCHR